MKSLKVFIIIIALTLSSLSVANVSELYEDAIQSYNNDDIDTAYIHLKNALNESPSHLPSKILMGKVLVYKGFLLDALIEFEEAQQANGDPNLIILPLANTHLLLEQFDEVVALSNDGLSPSNTADLYLVQGNAFLNLGQNDQAIKQYKSALAISPKDIGVLTNIAYFYLITQNQEALENTVTQMRTISANDFRVLHLEGQVLKSKKLFNEAHDYFERAYQANSSDPLVKRSLVSSLIQQQDYAQAKAIIEEILEQTPDDPFAMLYKGRLLRETQEGDAYKAIIKELNLSLAAIPKQIQVQRDELLIIRATASYLNGDYGKSVREFEAFLAKSPNNTMAMGLLADAYIRTGQERKALSLLENREPTLIPNQNVSLMLCGLYLNANKAFKCEQLITGLEKYHGPNPSFDFMRVRALLGLERYTDAIKLLETQFSSAEHEQVLLTSVSLYAANNQFDQALAQVDKLIAASDGNISAKLLKANLLISTGDYQAAKESIESALTTDSTSVQGRLSLARIYLNTGQYEQGLGIAQQLHDENKLDLAVSVLYGQLLVATNNDKQALSQLLAAPALSDDNPIASELLVKLYLRNGELEDALREINHLLRAYYLQPDYLLTKADILYQMNNIKDAQKQLNIVYGLWLEEPNRLSFLAEEQMDILDYEGASKSLNTAISLEPDDLNYRVQMMRLHLIQGQLEQAQKQIDAIEKSYPNSPVLSLMRGEVASEKGLLEQAYKEYLKAYQIDKNYSMALIKLYQLALRGIEKTSTIALMHSHLDAQEDDYLVRNLLADLLMTQGEYKQALGHYERLVSLKGLPSMDSVLNNIANIKLLTPNTLDEALSYATQALDLNPQSPDIMDTKAWILAKQSKYSEALNLMRQALALRADAPSMQYHLAYILAKLNRNAEAISELEKLLNDGASFSDRDEAEALLKTLLNT